MSTTSPSTTAGGGGISSNLAAEKRAQAQTQSIHDYRTHPTTAAPDTVIHAKHFSSLALIGLCYCILNSWTAASASMSIALISGGPSVTLWGMVVAFVGVMACALSMAEICHVYPTTGGQYHWSFLLAPARYRYAIAYFTGWISVAGWVALTATASSLAGQFIVGIIALLHENYESKPWHIFLVYVAFSLGAWTINAFGVRILDSLNRAAMIWSLVGAVVIMITCLARATPNYQSAKFVFGQFTNSTGWNNGVAWILGLLQAAFSLLGSDGATHLIDEIDRPAINAPRAMILAVAIGASSTFIVLMVFLFVLKDFDAVTSSPAGALLEIIFQAVGNRAGAVCLLIFPVVSMAFTATALLTTSSRMSQAFARDRGLPFSNLFAKISTKNEVPIPALILTTTWVIVFGCIYLGSTSALNAILSSSVVLLQFSYIIPIVLLLVRGRKVLDDATPEKRHFDLGPRMGPVINVFAVLFVLFTDVFFLFPPELPVTGSSMNYTVVVVAVVAIMSGAAWLLKGRKEFKGPLDMDEILFRTRGFARFDAEDASAASTAGAQVVGEKETS
ncbi:Amino acid/polyamine transporter I [Kalmanozyma brasiliensis GHG001]|uniref:Amino acid transporter n=1 Tax=Kalmanozyma brasiliensis (strain GHG001) TaxID=1365824 RepID=V5EQW1_KALBG|nr:Amino acid/polyamine transporter I [Kalmanozyma brasiliensis GHG001]EST05333.1 Amino acid/polyamine transporter I [Kalmanozyma brasiliensis GHG001]